MDSIRRYSTKQIIDRWSLDVKDEVGVWVPLSDVEQLQARMSELEALLNKVGHAEFQDDHVTCAWISRDAYDQIQALKGGE